MTKSEGRSKSRGLGRGLSALMADVSSDLSVSTEVSPPRRPDIIVPIEKVTPNPDQPRRTFDEEKLNDLCNSIREKGVIQPLIVRANPRKSGDYEIVAGERRWRASQLAKLHELPIIVREYDDTEVLEIAIIENIQRHDLNAIEEAAGYRQLMEKFGHTQEKLSGGLGKSRSHIANLMRLLQLPENVQEFVISGDISAGHARALVVAKDPYSLAKDVIKKGLSVRDIEKIVKAETTRRRPEKVKLRPESKDADTKSLESDLSAAIGMKVQIDHKEGSEKGVLTLSYKNLDELDTLCRVLSRGT